MSIEEINLLKTICLSGNEYIVKDMLYGINYSNFLQSSEAYLLLCNVLIKTVSSSVKIANNKISNSSSYLMISKILLQYGIRVNDDNCPKDIPTPLHIAVRTGNEELVKMLLWNGADVNKKHCTLITPLIFTFENNLTNIAEILIENGANPGNCDVSEKYTYSALHLAVVLENIEMVKFLLEKAVYNVRNDCWDKILQHRFLNEYNSISQLFLESPDNLDYSGTFEFEHPKISKEQTVSPLDIAVLQENKEIVEILLSKGVSVNTRNNNGYTPLHFAVMKNSIIIALILLQNGANCDILSNCGHKAFYYSQDPCMRSLYSMHKIEIYLNNGGNTEDKDDNFYTLLHYAVKYNLYNVVLLLLDKESNVNAVTKLGETPLHLAAIERNGEIAQLLLQRGANINAITNSGCTPLHLAANSNNLSYDESGFFLVFLLQNGANIAATNNFGLTPLNYAIKRQHLLDVEVLLGANPNVYDKSIKMAFCLSFFDHYHRNNCFGVTYCLKRCVSEVFIDFGLTIFIEDLKDMFIPEELYSSWLKQSSDKKFRSFVQDLLQKQNTFNTEEIVRSFIQFQVLVGAIKHGYCDIFLNLLTPNVNVNCRLQDGCTLLHHACRFENVCVVKELVRRGADINAIDVAKLSPLHISIFEFSYGVTEFLIKKLAYIEVRDENNETPLFSAVIENNLTSIRLLLEAGANVNVVNNSYESPICKAMGYGDINIIKILLHYGAFVNASDTFIIRSIFEALEEFDDDNDDFIFDAVDLVFSYGAEVIDLVPKTFIVDESHCARFQIKSAAANLEIIDFPIDSIELVDFQSQCLEEIQRMRWLKIIGFNISIYDFLIKPPRTIGMYMRNKIVVECLDVIDFEEKFPLYASKLDVCVMRGKLECRLLELAYHCLEVLKVKLPNVVISQIISYLDTSDLHRLIIASPISSKMKESVQYQEEL
ncbi:putative ankyrin repeat protein RF_0381 [Leptopilina boulardi]|uniref:putative ankyrin repeat protein RF_0381 n=1 Tax=Leptopilina boulardi TaxID=63433 RepID=UPI0021F53363|nr:putative ankyrin repeat protein RF_0381 [Leptopilina boulardi]